MQQFDSDPFRDGIYERLGRGLALFTIGFAKKVFIADPIAGRIDPIFADSAMVIPTLIDSWIAAFGFTFQLYFDFSAYSEMAIGLGLMLGLTLPINFDVPYRATSLRDFWRRWHMTLSRFLRDYLYIPLGGSHLGFGRYVLAAIVTMGLCGLWHGAGWTFVVWGLMHGVGLIVNRLWTLSGKTMPAAVGWLITMSFVLAGWVLFRSVDFSSAQSLFAGMAGMGGFGEWPDRTMFALLGIGALVSTIGPSSVAFARDILTPRLPYAIGFAVLAVACIFMVGAGAPVNFIYFQF